jgi:biopolymer transport protein ExbD
MPKVKIPRKSTNIDMTAMCDVAFLLLTFFMLTTKFKPDEAISVIMPKSVSEVKIPESEVVMITIDTLGRAFFGTDSQQVRTAALEEMSKIYGTTMTDEQKRRFKLTEEFGSPMKELGGVMDLSNSERAAYKQKGIPLDSIDGKAPELAEWIYQARAASIRDKEKDLRICIKGDGSTSYPIIKKLIKVLQDRDINKFNLVTALEASPAKAAAAAAAEH